MSRDRGGEGFEVLARGDSGLTFGSEFAPGVAGDGAAGLGGVFVLGKALRVFLPSDLGGGGVTYCNRFGAVLFRLSLGLAPFQSTPCKRGSVEATCGV